MKTHCTALLTLAAIVLLPVSSPLLAQTQEPTASFDGLVEVSEVLLDVLVTDKQGQVVLGLGPDDFTVEEEGQPVDVSGVSFYSNRIFLERSEDTPTAVAGAAEEVPADRYFVFVIHDQKRRDVDRNRYLRQQFEASRQSQRWVREEMLGGDWVAVASYDVKLKIHTDFTQDREVLIRALQTAARGKDPSNEWPSRRPSIENKNSLLARLPQGKELRRKSARIEDAMRLMAEALVDLPGRKNVLLFTTGFGLLDGSRPFSEPDPRYYPQMEKALNDHNVAVYPIDLTPLEFQHQHTDFLTQLARDTGGRYYEKFVSFLAPISEIADENNGYYLLSYQAQHPAGEQGYRQVRVRAKNPELKVRYRKGYRFGGA